MSQRPKSQCKRFNKGKILSKKKNMMKKERKIIRMLRNLINLCPKGIKVWNKVLSKNQFN